MKPYSTEEYKDILTRELFNGESTLKDGTFSDLIAELPTIEAYEKLLYTLVQQRVNGCHGSIDQEVENAVDEILIQASIFVDRIIAKEKNK